MNHSRPMADWNFTRRFTLQVDMSVQQHIAIGGLLTAYLVSQREMIRTLTYPNPTVGHNGKTPYIDMRFERLDCSSPLRSQRFLTHAVVAAVTFKGSFNGDVSDILDRFCDVVRQLAQWFLSNCTSWTDIKGRPVSMQGSATLSSRHTSDSEGLQQALSDWPAWQALRTVALTTKVMKDMDIQQGEFMCSSMTMAIFDRITLSALAVEESEQDMQDLLHLLAQETEEALDACWSMTTAIFNRLPA